MTKVSIFELNFDFSPKFRVWSEIYFSPKFRFLTKIPRFDQNYDFWPIFRCLTKIMIFDQYFDVWPKLWFLTNMSMFDQNYDFWPKFLFLTNMWIWPKVWFKNFNFWPNILMFDLDHENFDSWPQYLENEYLLNVKNFGKTVRTKDLQHQTKYLIGFIFCILLMAAAPYLVPEEPAPKVRKSSNSHDFMPNPNAPFLVQTPFFNRARSSVQNLNPKWCFCTVIFISF